MRRIKSVSVLLAAAAVAVSVAGTTMAGAVGSGSDPAGDPAVVSPIAWEPCQSAPTDPAFQCGTLPVPIDYANPDAGTVNLAVARHLADPATRIGSLLSNPGGPGASGVDYVRRGLGYIGTDLLSRFDFVSWDTRGTHASQETRCRADLVKPFRVPLSEGEYDQLIADNTAQFADCAARNTPLYFNMDTVATARDMDRLRAALGDEKLTYYGISYGTLVGQMYLELFPHRVRSMVLNSVVNHSAPIRRYLDDSAVAQQELFEQFIKACQADPGCALHGQDIRAIWTDLFARARGGELADPANPARLLIPLDLIKAAITRFYGPDWRGLARYIATLDAAGPAPATATAQPGAAAADDVPLVRSVIQVLCEDWDLPLRGFRDLATHLARLDRLAPDMHYSSVTMLTATGCAAYPDRPNNPQHRLRVAGSGVRTLLVNPRYDPATPYAGARQVAAELGNRARMLTYLGAGHDARGFGPCADRAMDAFLISLALPPDGAACPAVPPGTGAAAASRRPPAVPGDRIVPATSDPYPSPID